MLRAEISDLFKSAVYLCLIHNIDTTKYKKSTIRTKKTQFIISQNLQFYSKLFITEEQSKINQKVLI